MRPDGPRAPIAGPDDGPQPPFPLRLSGKVIKGFGRGSKEVWLTLFDIRFAMPMHTSNGPVKILVWSSYCLSQF